MHSKRSNPERAPSSNDRDPGVEACVLIVDDDDDVRSVVDELVESAGFRSRTASSGAEALELLETESVDLVIADIMMPDMDGLELTNVIKKDYEADVILMTGFSDKYSYEDAIYTGASDFILKPIRFHELILRIKRVLRERQFARERRDMMDRLEKLAITDGLTQLFNSRRFYQQLEEEVQRANRYRRPLSLILYDIDKFKQYNDTYGHLEGDKVLAAIARTTHSCLRRMDSAYRYGGEEFTVILPETEGAEAFKVAERLRRAIDATVFTPNPEAKVRIGVSLGVTQYGWEEEIPALVHRVDEAMYKAKRRGGNRVSYLKPPGLEESTS